MLYLLDANVLIDANRDYYPLGRVPEFWEWLVHNGTKGRVKIAIEVYEEIKDGKDDLAKWGREAEIKAALLLNEEADPVIVAHVINDGYATDLTDDEVAKVGRDPFLMAYALVVQGVRTVVTTEVSKPKRQRANRHLPDVCGELGIPCCNTFEFVRARLHNCLEGQLVLHGSHHRNMRSAHKFADLPFPHRPSDAILLPLTMQHARFSNPSSRANRSAVARRRARIVALVESLPEAAVTAAGEQHLSLEVRGKRFGYYLDDHHGDGRVALNCKAEPGANQSLTDFAPERFHIPAYLGPRGWIGLWIDLPTIYWDEVQSIIVDAYRLTAGKRLTAQLDQLDGGRSAREIDR